MKTFKYITILGAATVGMPIVIFGSISLFMANSYNNKQLEKAKKAKQDTVQVAPKPIYVEPKVLKLDTQESDTKTVKAPTTVKPQRKAVDTTNPGRIDTAKGM
jgi:predicted small secreted protein